MSPIVCIATPTFFTQALPARPGTEYGAPFVPPVPFAGALGKMRVQPITMAGINPAIQAEIGLIDADGVTLGGGIIFTPTTYDLEAMTGTESVWGPFSPIPMPAWIYVSISPSFHVTVEIHDEDHDGNINPTPLHSESVAPSSSPLATGTPYLWAGGLGGTDPSDCQVEIGPYVWEGGDGASIPTKVAAGQSTSGMLPAGKPRT